MGEGLPVRERREEHLDADQEILPCERGRQPNQTKSENSEREPATEQAEPSSTETETRNHSWNERSEQGK